MIYEFYIKVMFNFEVYLDFEGYLLECVVWK